MRKPFRLGRVHGLSLIFRALQPCSFIYLCALVIENLTHACARDVAAPAWRKLVFNGMCLVMIASGFMRARRPLASTDLPFLLTAMSLFVIAMLPPPALLHTGPLCAAPTLPAAAERLVRALLFSFSYSVFVYAAAPPVQSQPETIICVMRASAASIWILAAHTYFLPLAFVQNIVVIYVRVVSNEYAIDDDYAPVSPLQPLPPHADVESCESGAREMCEPFALPSAGGGGGPEPEPTIDTAGMITPNFAPLGPRGLVDIGGARAHSAAELAVIAARMEGGE